MQSHKLPFAERTRCRGTPRPEVIPSGRNRLRGETEETDPLDAEKPKRNEWQRPSPLRGSIRGGVEEAVTAERVPGRKGGADPRRIQKSIAGRTLKGTLVGGGAASVSVYLRAVPPCFGTSRGKRLKYACPRLRVEPLQSNASSALPPWFDHCFQMQVPDRLTQPFHRGQGCCLLAVLDCRGRAS